MDLYLIKREVRGCVKIDVKICRDKEVCPTVERRVVYDY